MCRLGRGNPNIFSKSILLLRINFSLKKCILISPLKDVGELDILMQLQENGMEIDLNELEKIILILLSKLKQSCGAEININSDYYWDVSSEEIFNPYKEPQNMDLGQLTDDWQTLQNSIVSGILIPYDLQRVSNLLKALSIENPIAF